MLKRGKKLASLALNWKYYFVALKQMFFRPRLLGEELYTQMSFFVQTIWSIDIFIVEKCEWYH